MKINYPRLIRNRWTVVAVITLVSLVVGLIVTLIQPFQYRSEVKILVIQKSAVSIDAYSASKSAERIGNNLGQVIYSSNFLEKILNSGYQIDASYFSRDEEKRRREWRDMLESEVPSNSTILDIKVYHSDREQATILAQAISYVLMKQVDEYIGITDVELKVVDAPLTSNFPVRPNFLLNSLFSLLLGFFISLAYLILTYTEDHEARELFMAVDHTKRPEEGKHLKAARQHWERAQSVPSVIPALEESADELEIAEAIESSEAIEPIVETEVEDLELPSISDSLGLSDEVEEVKAQEPVSRASLASLPSYHSEDEIVTMPDHHSN